MASFIKLIANDGTVFKVEQDVALKSKLVKDICALQGFENVEITVSKADGRTLRKVIEYCVRYRNDIYIPKGEDEDKRIELTERDLEYLEKMDGSLLVAVLSAANCLGIPGLMDIVSMFIANMIIGKSQEEIRYIYQLPDDLTEEQKQERREQYTWLDI